MLLLLLPPPPLLLPGHGHCHVSALTAAAAGQWHDEQKCCIPRILTFLWIVHKLQSVNAPSAP